MKPTKILVLSLFIICNGQNIFSQTVPRADEIVERERQQQLREQRHLDARNKLNGYDREGFISERDKSPMPPSLYKGRNKEVGNLNKTFEKTRYMLDVPKTYYEKYKELLDDKKTHLTRLQPDKNCYGKYQVSVEQLERCSNVIPIPGGGALYSFRSALKFPKQSLVMVLIEDEMILTTSKPTQGFEQVDWWNIRFINDKFIVQNSNMRGIISEIGDVDLKSIDLTSKELEFLNNFKQKDTLPEIKEQSDALKNGISFNNFVYSNTSPVKVNSTYVLRSIDYGSIIGQTMFLKQYPPAKQLKMKKSFVDERADLTIAFKVVGREDDGSVIILWKELKAGPLPN